MGLLQPLAGGIPADTIREAVREIASGRAYHRSLRTSLFDRLWRWVSELLDRLFSAVAELPNGRTIGIAIVVGVVLLIVARIVYSTRLGLDELELQRTRKGQARTNPLADAEQLAAQGAWLEAAHALYRASLEVIAREHGVRLHPSRTSGDYVRDLRRRGSPAAATFRQFARRYDRMVFGSVSCDAEGWASLRSDFDGVGRQGRAA